ncbi:DUF1876 domain-containing protein [Modestobacter marinus]|uniref:DUF1876 domain-containing protein n=1 Tax=Modestobacter marinus TaxID=477641 RepID=UPI001C94F386|nr:DUF1876 domain-containing protein [Modestobacter marinus]
MKTWTVHVDIDEHEDRTRAVARLSRGEDQSLAGTGLARLNPADRNVPQIGDELAVARALSELSHLLLDVAARDIEQISGVPAHPVL